MAPVDDHQRAAPPDDGGHHGSFTRPEETMAVSGEGPAPELHRDSTATRSPWRLTWGIAAVAGGVIVLSLLLAAPYLP